MPKLTPAQQQALRARADGLNPVVLISEKGLSDAVLIEIDRNLNAHELIKIRTFIADREARAGILDKICSHLNAEPVQHIGKILVIYRENPESKKPTKQKVDRAAKSTGAKKPQRRKI